MAAESKLQSKIRVALEKAGWLVVKITICSKPGWPDLEAIRNGRTVRLEIKDKGKEASPLQMLRNHHIREHGGEVYVVDTFEEFLKLKLI